MAAPPIADASGAVAGFTVTLTSSVLPVIVTTRILDAGIVAVVAIARVAVLLLTVKFPVKVELLISLDVRPVIV